MPRYIFRKYIDVEPQLYLSGGSINGKTTDAKVKGDGRNQPLVRPGKTADAKPCAKDAGNDPKRHGNVGVYIWY